MENVDTNTLANIILTAPRWAQTSLAASGFARQRAAEELARAILAGTAEQSSNPHPDQLGLSL